MAELLKFFKDASPALVLLAIVAFFVRMYIEGMIKGRFATLENLMKSSIAINEGLRDNEQRELVEFRIAVERWEYFLQTGIADIVMRSESTEFEPADFHRRDVQLYGEVREAAVKASIYLRDQALEAELMKAIAAIRHMYYPLLSSTMQRVLETQEQMLPLLGRMKQFELSGMKDTSVALTTDEAQHLMALRYKMTAELRTYAETLVAQYRPIAEQLYDLKQRINAHIYRPATV
jgi:hypothetical protein